MTEAKALQAQDTDAGQLISYLYRLTGVIIKESMPTRLLGSHSKAEVRIFSLEKE
jgi:hypothetical protein